MPVSLPSCVIKGFLPRCPLRKSTIAMRWKRTEVTSRESQPVKTPVRLARLDTLPHHPPPPLHRRIPRRPRQGHTACPLVFPRVLAQGLSRPVDLDPRTVDSAAVVAVAAAIAAATTTTTACREAPEGSARTHTEVLAPVARAPTADSAVAAAATTATVVAGLPGALSLLSRPPPANGGARSPPVCPPPPSRRRSWLLTCPTWPQRT